MAVGREVVVMAGPGVKQEEMAAREVRGVRGVVMAVSVAKKVAMAETAAEEPAVAAEEAVLAVALEEAVATLQAE